MMVSLAMLVAQVALLVWLASSESWSVTVAVAFLMLRSEIHGMLILRARAKLEQSASSETRVINVLPDESMRADLFKEFSREMSRQMHVAHGWRPN